MCLGRESHRPVTCHVRKHIPPSWTGVSFQRYPCCARLELYFGKHCQEHSLITSLLIAILQVKGRCDTAPHPKALSVQEVYTSGTCAACMKSESVRHKGWAVEWDELKGMDSGNTNSLHQVFNCFPCVFQLFLHFYLQDSLKMKS